MHGNTQSVRRCSKNPIACFDSPRAADAPLLRGRRHLGLALTSDCDGACVDDVAGALVGGDRFPGQRRLIAAEVPAFGHARIGRNSGSRDEDQQIPRHDRLGIDVHDRRVAHYTGLRGRDALERGESRVSP